MSAPTFNPSPEQAASLLADLDSPDLSFRELAAKHGTNSEALAVWLNTAATRERIDANLDAVAVRVRAVAVNLLPKALGAIAHVLDHYKADHASALNAPEHTPDHTDDAAIDRQRRRDETTRRAAYLLFRLANFFPPSRQPLSRIPARHTGQGLSTPIEGGLRGGQGLNNGQASGVHRNGQAPIDGAALSAKIASFSDPSVTAPTQAARPCMPRVFPVHSSNAAAPAVLLSRPSASPHSSADSLSSLLSELSSPLDAGHPLTRKASKPSRPSSLFARAGACQGAAP